MGHYTLSGLSSQQKLISTSDYDLRVTNLARFIYKKIKKILGKNKEKLIDIGAGNGLVLRFFRDKGYEVTGMELSRELCDLMKKNPVMKGIEIIRGDISKTSGKGDFNVVLASDVIEHIKNDEAALKNLFSFVKPGGILVISVPAHMLFFGKRDKLWGHYRRYDRSQLIAKIEKLKGKIEFTTYWNLVGYFAYFFYEKILNKPIREDFRYTKSFFSRITRLILDFLLKIEEAFGFSPIGLTLIVGIKKNK